MRLTPQHYFLIVFILLLTDCSPRIATVKLTEIADINTISTQIATTMVAHVTQTATTVHPISTTTPSSTPLPLFPLDGYVILFIKDEDLYFQDGNNAPFKLTHVGKQLPDPKLSDDTQLVIFSPILSDDNQKVVFARSDGNIYSITTNGIQEQIIIPNDWLASFIAGTKIGILQFIPGTHLLFLETHLCTLQEHIHPCANSIFLADTDTGGIKKLADFSLNYHFYGTAPRNIAVSPNGKMLAVGTPDGLDILTLDGKMIRNNILPYTSSLSHVSFPTLSWLPDSSGLIVALPNTTYSTTCNDFTAHTIWRYTISNNTTIQIPLDPPPMDTFVSPDGNWVVYSNYCQSLLYRGNLTNGQVDVFGEEENHPVFFWSLDSKHVIYLNNIVISFEKPPVSWKVYPRWIDTNHFLYFNLPGPEEKTFLGEINEKEIHYFALSFPTTNFFTLKPK